MTMNTMLNAVLAAFHAEYADARPSRIGTLPAYALASLVCLIVLERVKRENGQAACGPTLSEEQRQSIVLEAISQAEVVLGRTLGTNLPGYFAISRRVAEVMGEWPLI